MKTPPCIRVKPVSKPDPKWNYWFVNSWLKPCCKKADPCYEHMDRHDMIERYLNSIY